jgi:hypothetical protein
MQTPDKPVELTLVLDPVQHEKLPLASTLLNLELSAVQPLHQIEDQRITYVRMFFLVVGINHYLINLTAVYDKIHRVSGALGHHKTRLIQIAIFCKSPRCRSTKPSRSWIPAFLASMQDVCCANNIHVREWLASQAVLLDPSCMLLKNFSLAFVILGHLIVDFVRLMRGLLQSRSALAAENLFLRKQLGLYLGAIQE